jgi:hypothetical protein
MKKIITLFAFIVLCNLLFAQNKYAIIVALSKYNEDWETLSSENDLKLVNETLINKGFNQKNIKKLVNEFATSANLDLTFDSLIKIIQPNDIVYFHFSGHGQQVADIKPIKRKNILIPNDEIDRLDEALVMYNAPKNWSEGYEYEEHYVDDQLNSKFDLIREKLEKKGQLIVVIDACHSGTIARGEKKSKSRGTSIVCAPSDWNSKSDTLTNLDYVSGEQKLTNNNNKASLFCFYGCKSNQTNNEYYPPNNRESYGSLSWFLCQSLNKSNDNLSYNNLFLEIKKSMFSIYKNEQTPGFESSNSNKLVFLDIDKSDESFFTIKSLNNDTIFINGGALAGLQIGDEMGLMDLKEESFQLEKIITKGKVIKIDEMNAAILLETSLSSKKINEYKIYLVNKNENNKLKVKIELLKKSSNTMKLFSNLTEIKIDKNNYDYILSEITPNKFGIFSIKNQNYLCRNMSPIEIKEENDLDSFRKLLKEIIRIKELRSLKKISNEHKFDLKVKNRLNEIIDTSNMKVKLGNGFEILITNNSNLPLSFQIIDIQPNDVINFLKNNDECIIQSNESKKLSILNITPPEGLEELVFIASPKPIELNDFININASTRGINSMKELFTVDKLSNHNISIFSINFEILKN